MTVVGEVLILVGACLALVAALGAHRFRDVYARSHAAGKATSTGALCILLGAALVDGHAGRALLYALIGIFLLVTLPVGVHAVIRAAYRSGVPLADGTPIDDGAPHPGERDPAT